MNIRLHHVINEMDNCTLYYICKYVSEVRMSPRHLLFISYFAVFCFAQLDDLRCFSSHPFSFHYAFQEPF